MVKIYENDKNDVQVYCLWTEVRGTTMFIVGV